MTAITTLDKTIQKTNVWMRETLVQLGWTSNPRAYTALRAVLHALRDRLPLAEAVQLGAQLPTFLRGVYYEGWNPARTPIKDRRRETFLSEIRAAFQPRADVDEEQVARAVVRVLLNHVSKGEMEQVRNSLPHDIRAFFPSIVPFMMRNAS
jgi:uncharacterized protein (DUF2267 family)